MAMELLDSFAALLEEPAVPLEEFVLGSLLSEELPLEALDSSAFSMVEELDSSMTSSVVDVEFSELQAESKSAMPATAVRINLLNDMRNLIVLFAL